MPAPAPIDGASRATRGQQRSFGLLLAAAFALAGFWPWVAGRSAAAELNLWALAVAVAALAAALLRPRLLGPAAGLWLGFGRLSHRLLSPVVMACVFFAVVTPLALAMRLAGRDPLRRRFEPGAPSYWIEREPGPAPDTMKHQF